MQLPRCPTIREVQKSNAESQHNQTFLLLGRDIFVRQSFLCLLIWQGGDGGKGFPRVQFQTMLLLVTQFLIVRIHVEATRKMANKIEPSRLITYQNQLLLSHFQSLQDLQESK